jgi:hypothetical protein
VSPHLELFANGEVAYIDFHCSDISESDYDGRILCSKPTTAGTTGTSTMMLVASKISVPNNIDSASATAVQTLFNNHTGDLYINSGSNASDTYIYSGKTRTNTIICKNNTTTIASNSPDTSDDSNLILSSTKTGSTPYRMAIGLDNTTGYGYINAAGNSTTQPILLNSRGGSIYMYGSPYLTPYVFASGTRVDTLVTGTNNVNILTNQTLPTGFNSFCVNVCSGDSGSQGGITGIYGYVTITGSLFNLGYRVFGAVAGSFRLNYIIYAIQST